MDNTARLISQDNVPLYRTLKNHIWRKIRNRELLVGDKLPSENELAAEMNVSRITIRRAFRELQQEGIIHRVKGLGTYVANPTSRFYSIQLPDIKEYITEKGQRHRQRVLRLKEENPGEKTSLALKLTPGETVFHLILLHYGNETPVILEDRYVVSALFPDFIEQNFERLTVVDYFLKRAILERVEHRVSAINLANPETDYLDVNKGTPAVLLERRTFSFGRPTTCSRIFLPSGRFDLESQVDLGW